MFCSLENNIGKHGMSFLGMRKSIGQVASEINTSKSSVIISKTLKTWRSLKFATANENICNTN